MKKNITIIALCLFVAYLTYDNLTLSRQYQKELKTLKNEYKQAQINYTNTRDSLIRIYTRDSIRFYTIIDSINQREIPRNEEIQTYFNSDFIHKSELFADTIGADTIK